MSFKNEKYVMMGFKNEECGMFFHGQGLILFFSFSSIIDKK